jgi:hypothetical protein
VRKRRISLINRSEKKGGGATLEENPTTGSSDSHLGKQDRDRCVYRIKLPSALRV